MPSFSPELVALMRTVLDDVMLKVPASFSSATTKVLLAEVILHAASKGQADYQQLFASAESQIQTVVSILS